MNGLLRAVQRAVRSTNRWPVLGAAYRRIYDRAADEAGRMADLRGVVGVHARHSYALGTWEAGQSDIDLTLVLRTPTTGIVDAVQQRYERLRRRYPMLGELEMLDERDLGAWSRVGITGLEARRWRRLGGAPAAIRPYAGRERLDRVRRAVSIYRHQFVPRYWDTPPRPHVLRRLSAGMARQLGATAGGTSDRGRQLDEALRLLSDAIAGLPPMDQGLLVDYGNLLGGVGGTQGPAGSPPSNIRAVVGHDLGASHRHVVVEHASGAAAAAAPFTDATIMTPDVFRFYLCHVDPLEYFSLLRDRVVFAGADPLREAFPLTDAAFRATVCHYAVDLLTFPYRPGLADLSDVEFQNLLYGWFLRTLRYFEDGRFSFDYGEIRAHFGGRHPERAPRFALLHAVAGDVSRIMSD